MKAELTQENKAKFFALYWGQKVLNCNIPYKKNAKILGFQIDRYMVYRPYLSLKPLSQISDDDASSLCRLFSSYFPDDSVAAVQGRILVTEYIRRTSNLTAHDWFFGLDFLRSRGYALPWMGLSVDELIGAGWIRLTES